MIVKVNNKEYDFRILYIPKDDLYRPNSYSIVQIFGAIIAGNVYDSSYYSTYYGTYYDASANLDPVWYEPNCGSIMPPEIIKVCQKILDNKAFA